MRIQDEPDIPFTINIVPMIDVIFSILAFVIITSLDLTRSQGLPVNLPSANTVQQQPSTDITVTVESNGSIYLNKEPIELNVLTEEVRNLVNPNNPSLVIINADEGVQHGQVVQIMDRVRQVEGARLAIAAQKSR